MTSTPSILALILLSTLSAAAYLTIASRLMRSLPSMSSNFFLSAGSLAAALLLFPLWLWRHSQGGTMLPGSLGWQYFLLAAGLLLLTKELYFYAYSKADMANVTVFSALTPLYTVLTGFILLHERPSLRVLGGMLIITLAIYSIFLPPHEQKTPWVAYFVQPFRRIFSATPIFCGFLSTLPIALAVVYQKMALQRMDIISFNLGMFFAVGGAALAIELIKSDRGSLRANMASVGTPLFWCSALLLAGMNISFAPILLSQQCAAALALQRCGILFQILFAYFFLHQRTELRKRLAAGLMIILGFVLIGVQAGQPGDAGIEWVTIPGGSVPTFRLAKTEVTFGQYGKCVKAGACTPPRHASLGDDHPVVGVDWEQARSFSEWAGGRLPTEAEWEYAARSGGKERDYPWGSEASSCDRAVEAAGLQGGGGPGCGKESSWPVCSKPAGRTEQGLCDMAGNVWEWVQDSDGTLRVIRGGGWRGGGRRARATSRTGVAPDRRYDSLGFRPARSR